MKFNKFNLVSNFNINLLPVLRKICGALWPKKRSIGNGFGSWKRKGKYESFALCTGEVFRKNQTVKA